MSQFELESQRQRFVLPLRVRASQHFYMILSAVRDTQQLSQADITWLAPVIRTQDAALSGWRIEFMVAREQSDLVRES